MIDPADVTDRSARGIARAVAEMIDSGQLVPGTRLPSVRQLGTELEVSPATVSAAWGELSEVGLLATRGRGGTIVLGPAAAPMPARLARSVAPRGVTIDLSLGFPDPALLPDLRGALRAAASSVATRISYFDDPIVAELREILVERWPYEPEAMAITNGALAALDAIISLTVRPGSVVAVEQPTFAGLLDRLDATSATLLPLDLDAHGVVPESLDMALRSGASVVFTQPRAQNPTGASMTRQRVVALADIAKSHPHSLFVEDDHSGAIATAAPVSLGRHHPRRTVRIEGFSKSHGPDLRVAAVAGPTELIDDMTSRRTLADGWTSRLLQMTLAELLKDPDSNAVVDGARYAYRERAHDFVSALADHGVELDGMPDGFNCWIPTADETSATTQLAADGIGVARGSPLLIEQPSVLEGASDHIRVTFGVISENVGAIAQQVAAATMNREPLVMPR